jgi:hypothetical protein
MNLRGGADDTIIWKWSVVVVELMCYESVPQEQIDTKS